MTVKRPTLAYLYGNIACKCPICIGILLGDWRSDESLSDCRSALQEVLRQKLEYSKAEYLANFVLYGAAAKCPNGDD